MINLTELCNMSRWVCSKVQHISVLFWGEASLLYLGKGYLQKWMCVSVLLSSKRSGRPSHTCTMSQLSHHYLQFHFHTLQLLVLLALRGLLLKPPCVYISLTASMDSHCLYLFEISCLNIKKQIIKLPTTHFILLFLIQTLTKDCSRL